jgi:hypothetical protein
MFIVTTIIGMVLSGISTHYVIQEDLKRYHRENPRHHPAERDPLPNVPFADCVGDECINWRGWDKPYMQHIFNTIYKAEPAARFFTKQKFVNYLDSKLRDRGYTPEMFNDVCPTSDYPIEKSPRLNGAWYHDV